MQPDVIVIGAGIAGASAASFLSRDRRVLLLERETQPGYHTTGRSAAVYSENYGTDTVSALVRASGGFLKDPPPGFADYKLLEPLGQMMLAGPDDAALLEDEWITAKRRVPSMERHGLEFALAKAPLLKPGLVTGCLWEPGACDIDVNGLLRGYLRVFARNGGSLKTDCLIDGIERHGDLWRVISASGERFEAPILVNAGGAWADRIGALAGAAPIGLEPRRRTALLIDLPPELSASPMTICLGGGLYFRPQSGKLLVSPADETPAEPSDVQPEELDIAVTIDRLTTLTGIEPRRIDHSWAGLRSFVPDENPVAGWDETVPGLYWLAGQGGAGIKTSPALGMLAAAMVTGGALPDTIRREEIDPVALSPARLQKVSRHPRI